MYFYGILSQKPTCLYRTKEKNFVIIETQSDDSNTEYELLINPLSSKDALDICLQDDTNIAKMMLEMQLYDKTGREENITGNEKNILKSFDKQDLTAIKTAFSLVKNLRLKSLAKTAAEEDFKDDAEHFAYVESVHQSLLKRI